MKHFFTIILTYFLVQNISAQILYQQDFSNGFGDMILLDVDKKTAATQVANFKDAWTISGELSGGNPAAISNSWYTPAARADDWMMTPVITGIEAKTHLVWSARAINSDFPDGYEVRVSATGGTATADFKDIIFQTTGENPTLTKRVANLAAYSGMDIRIAFRNNSNDMLLLLVDDISVEILKGVDGSTQASSKSEYIPIGQDGGAEFALVNEGADPITSFKFEWSNGVDTYQDSISGIDIKTFESYVGEFSFPVILASRYDITVKLLTINGGVDENGTNDISTSSLNGISQTIKKKMVAEQATGTWCTWCPRGAVFMDRMAKDYPNEFIGIAVHNNDPMALAAYDSGITNLPGFGGFPSVVINREDIIDPSRMPEYFTVVTRNEFSPVEMNVEQSKVGRAMTISGDITFYTDLDAADYSVVVAVLEDEVKGTTSGYAQVNAYSGGASGPMGGYENLPNPVPANQMVYQDVARALPFGFRGRSTVIPDVVKDGDSFIFSVNYTLPASFVVGNIRSVLFLRDNATGQIVTGAKSESFAVGIEEISEIANLSISPNPSSTESFVNLELKSSSEVSMTIFNNIGQQVVSRNYGKLDGRQILPIIVDGYETGIYFVKLTVNGKVTTQKLIVE